MLPKLNKEYSRCVVSKVAISICDKFDIFMYFRLFLSYDESKDALKIQCNFFQYW